MKQIDLTNKRFGRLIAIKTTIKDKYNHIQWLCKCDCGNYTVARTSALTSGAIKSCGCLKKEYAKENIKKLQLPKHNLTKSRLYRIWQSMKNRCNNYKVKSYKYYGARGIKVCDEWKNDFMFFHDWAFANGYDENAKFQECTLDRIDFNGNYEPSNCRWVNIKIQQNNRRSNVFLTYNNETHTVAEWAEKLNVKKTLLYDRLKYGWSIEKTLNI